MSKFNEVANIVLKENTMRKDPYEEVAKETAKIVVDTAIQEMKDFRDTELREYLKYNVQAVHSLLNYKINDYISELKEAGKL